MADDQYDAVQGQLEAFNLILTSLIVSMSPVQARQSVAHLQAAFDIHCENEREERQADLTRVLIREAFVESYIGLLNAACSKED